MLYDRRLLLAIFKFLRPVPSILARAACVNKLWYETAMDVLWADVPAGGIRPILNMLPEYFEHEVCGSLKSVYNGLCLIYCR